MRLALTYAQIEEMKAHLRPGVTLLAKITRETFDGSNPSTSGEPFIDFGAVPTSSIDALRTAIREANDPTPKPKRRKNQENP